jgi:hypothetical protein
MIRSLSIAISLILLAQTAMAQTVARPRAGVTAIPKATQFSIQPLTPSEMQARLRPAPTFLPPAQLNIPIPAVITLMNAPFSLTPAVQSIAGRGSLMIQGQIFAPDSGPSGFQGQATISRVASSIPGQDDYGKVVVTVNAQKNKFYAVDCLARIDQWLGAPYDYTIHGSNADTTSSNALNNGHIIINVRRTESDGEITIMFRPRLAKRSRPNGSWDTNIMDFWGCQITPGG